MTSLMNDDLQRQLMALFVVETQEHIQTVNQHLLALEANPASETVPQTLADILREAHSLKGSSRSANLPEVEAMAHALESLFAGVQNGELGLGSEVFDLTYQAMDAIGALVQHAAGAELTAVDAPGLIARIENLASRHVSEPIEPLDSILPKKASRKKGSKPAGDLATLSQSQAFLMAAGQGVPEPDPLPQPPPALLAATQSVSQDDPVKVPPPPAFLVSATQPVPNMGELPQSEETVRLTTSKLDALLSQMGELQVTRIESEQRLVELRSLEESITQWEMEWRKTRPLYRRLLLSADGDALQGESHHLGETAHVIEPLLEFLQANEARLRAMRERVNTLNRVFKADSRRMAGVVSGMEEEIRQTRMLPVSTVFNAFPRMVRDLARDNHKEVVLVITGGDTDVDRSVLEQIKDPLLHLLRNCIDHGIELPDVRKKAGKSKQGMIHLNAAHHGDSLMIEIIDDGAGVDLAAVRAAAVRKRLLTEQAAEGLSDQDALWLIFRPGLSTSPIITDLSGRGVGLDVVRQRVEHLHGLIDVENRPGQGVRFTLTVPLTVATTLCLLIQAGSRKEGAETLPYTFALPISNVIRLIRLAPDEIGFAEGRQAIRQDGGPMVLSRLSDVLGLDPGPALKNGAKLPAIVVGAGEKRMAFLVDTVLGAQEMVIKSLPRPLLRIRNTAGATIMGTGAVVVVLHTTDLLASAERVQPRAAREVEMLQQVENKTPVIMVTDDSITTRTLEKNILEAAGYVVHAASDGLDAWTQLQTEPCDLLVSDVMMPRLDGIGLATKLRADERYKHLPIILVTSLDSATDRERGVQAGADAYIVKSALDQDQLLDTIRRLI
jgi:two-component system chemotaxis sensor kinase CheA